MQGKHTAIISLLNLETIRDSNRGNGIGEDGDVFISMCLGFHKQQCNAGYFFIVFYAEVFRLLQKLCVLLPSICVK